MIRVCPERDAECPHGIDCPFAEGYHCRPNTAEETLKILRDDLRVLPWIRRIANAGLIHSVKDWKKI